MNDELSSTIPSLGGCLGGVKKAASPCARDLVQSVMQVVAMVLCGMERSCVRKHELVDRWDQDLHGKMVADVYLTLFHITGRW